MTSLSCEQDSEPLQLTLPPPDPLTLFLIAWLILPKPKSVAWVSAGLDKACNARQVSALSGPQVLKTKFRHNPSLDPLMDLPLMGKSPAW